MEKIKKNHRDSIHQPKVLHLRKGTCGMFSFSSFSLFLRFLFTVFYNVSMYKSIVACLTYMKI